MKKEHKIALKTMAMKARLVNFLRTELYGYSNNNYAIQYKGKKPITDEVKIKTFDEMYKILNEVNTELVLYKLKRKRRSEIERLRNEKKLEKSL